MATSSTQAGELARVKLERGGLRLGEELLPFYAGAVHYWRLSPDDWLPCLEAVRELREARSREERARNALGELV